MNMQVREIERRVDTLNWDERLWLIERLVRGLRKGSSRAILKRDLEEMAADPDIQREIREIDREFSVTESDGLKAINSQA